METDHNIPTEFLFMTYFMCKQLQTW